MLNVATATKPACSFRYMPPVSARALPREQNERLRVVLREIIAKDFDGVISHAATKLKVSHATLSDVLSGKRGVGQKLLNALADHRHASIDELLGRRAVVYDLAEYRSGSKLGQHPQWTAAALELRRKIARRGAAVDESAMQDLEGVALSRSVTVLTAEFLMRVYDALLQARDDNAADQDSDADE